MAHQRCARLLVALVLALGARLVYAVPAQAIAELEAVSHCTRHTGHPASVPGARRCCGVSSEADTPAIVAVGIAPPPAVAVLRPDVPPVPTSRTSPETTRSLAISVRDGPPRYLTLLAIRR